MDKLLKLERIKAGFPEFQVVVLTQRSWIQIPLRSKFSEIPVVTHPGEYLRVEIVKFLKKPVSYIGTRGKLLQISVLRVAALIGNVLRKYY